MNRHDWRMCGLAAATALGGLPGVAWAQAPAATGRGVEEVVVTAQRRTQSLQKTSLTIAVISPKVLANAGITSPLQLTTIAPTLQVSSSGPSVSIYVRGVGNFASTAEQSPAVPFYIDGVYVSRSQSVSSEFYDTSRLEVLKGPQGTLYGRNATGGAVNILTRKPDLGVYNGYADFEVGNYNDRVGDFAVNVPVGPTVAVRLSAQIADRGGTTSEGFNDDIHQSGRVKLLWQPNGDASLLVNASYGHIGGKGPGFVVLNKDVPGWKPWLDTTAPQAQAYQVQHAVAPIPGFDLPVNVSEGRQDLSFYNVSAQFDYNLGPVTFTLLPAYRYARMQYDVLFSTLYANGYGFGTQGAQPETSRQASVEARLAGNGTRLKWVAGLYFFNEDQFQQYHIDAGLPENDAFVASFGTRSYAAFGQATYAITPNFRLIGGLRYTSDQRSLIDGQTYVISPTLFLGPPPAGAGPCAFPAPSQPQCLVETYSGNKTFTNISWKGGFEADVLQDSLLYATASRGFKAGGFNTQSILGAPGQAIPFAPERLTAYELGLKNRFLNNRLQVNVTGFYWDYKEHQEPQLAFTNQGLENLIFFNAGAAEIYGGDLDLVAQAWQGATFNTSVEYTNSHYQSFVYSVPTATFAPGSTGCRASPAATPGQTSIDCSGFQTVRTPKLAGNVGFTQNIAFEGGSLTGNLNLTYSAARWGAVDFTPIEREPGYASLDVAVTYNFPGGHWALTAFGRNVNNAVIYTQAFTNAFSSVRVANINNPATYGGRLSYTF